MDIDFRVTVVRTEVCKRHSVAGCLYSEILIRKMGKNRLLGPAPHQCTDGSEIWRGGVDLEK